VIKTGTLERPLRVAIIGSGPSGFYAADSLFKSSLPVTVDMFEQLPTPFGLARSGVAPDHEKIREITKYFHKIASKEHFAFFGNVALGYRVSVQVLKRYYDAIIFACGTTVGKNMGIPGEDLPGCHTAATFVGWYNGHPAHAEFPFDLSHETAVVIGVGNVALDVARILTKTVDELKHTDISRQALDALATSKIKEVHVIGRRGPVQAKFKENEIKELGRLRNCACIIDPHELEINAASEKELEEPGARRILSILHEMAQQPLDTNKQRRIHLRFLMSPIRIEGTSRVESILLEKNILTGEAFKQKAKGTGEIVEIPCGLVFSSIGYRANPIPGVPFNHRLGIIANQEGRVTEDNEVVPGLYTVGWIKRGPSGLIGANKPCSAETVQKLLEDLPSLPPCEVPSTDEMKNMLARRGVRFVSYEDWLKIDALEQERGKLAGKPRERFTRISEMMDVLTGE